MDSKDISATGRHAADLAMMRLGRELRRRLRNRMPLTDALRDTALRLDAAAALLWMPHGGLRVAVAGKDGAISVPVGAELDGIATRLAQLKQDGQPTIFQGDDPRAERRAACRLLIVQLDTGTTRFPAWLVFARELAEPRFDTWAAVLAQVQGLRLARRVTLEFDPTTGHLSRRGLRTAFAQRVKGWGALILADLDGLRTLNHTRGIVAGDDVVNAFSRLLRPPQLPEGTLVARLEGGKFALFVPGLGGQAAAQLATSLQSVLENVKIKGREDFPRVTFSCGIAEYDIAAESIDKPLLAADIVLRLAKERGRARVEVHQAMDASVIRRYDNDFAATELRDAIRDKRLELHAQPIVSLRDRKHPLGFELLLRLRDETGAICDPGRLLAVASRYQMLPMVDRYVVEHAFSVLAPHREVLARQRVTMGINISGQSLCDPEFAAYFMEELRKSRLHAGCVVVEITEQVAAGNLIKAADVMRRLRAAGCGIAIDDFGTGANSLAYVHQLPVTRLKIDGSFVRDITTNKKSEAAVRSIVQLARDFVLQTVGEYVEDQAQSELLRKLGVDLGQGYFFGKAGPLDATMAMLVERESASTQAVSDVG
jgi:diguanylate cyclase (GGDEF)-like protein